MDIRRESAEYESKAANISEQIEEARNTIDTMKEQAQQRKHEFEEVTNRLSEVEQNANVDRRDEQIQNLEAELQTTRRTLKEKWKREVDSLRQELMDYVRFIVNILPENWTEMEGADMVPKLKDQVSSSTASRSIADPFSSGR